jgi:beta-1,4-mannosyltransferase
LSGRGPATESELTAQRIVVIVQGEVAQSPRMMNHVRALLAEGAHVDLVGVFGVAPPPDMSAAPNLQLHALPGADADRRLAVPLASFLIAGAVRSARVALRLGRLLVFGLQRADVFLVQNPPAVPALVIAWCAAKLRGTRLVVDWHNYTFSMLAARLGMRHTVVRLVRALESWLARRSDAHLCVSDALRRDLKARWDISAAVVHDRPIARTARTERDRDSVLRAIAEATGYVFPAEAERFVFAVCPTSWTIDEDMPMVLEAATAFARNSAAPPLILFATGRGPRRSAFESAARVRETERLRVVTGWLPDDLYRDLLAVSDVGISAHRSTSGLDIPMKLVDMAAAALPPVVFDYAECWAELLDAPMTAGTFNDEASLCRALTVLFQSYPVLTRLQAVRAALRETGPDWPAEWTRAALPSLFA